MNSNKKRLRQRIVDTAATWGISIPIIIVAFVFAYQFVGPAPPDKIVMATGEAGGAYHQFGEAFADLLDAEGITLELRTTAGSVENMSLLNEDSGVDIAFVQGGIANVVPSENVAALGSLYLEPMWIVSRKDTPLASVGDLSGKRVSIGAEGSGTRAVALLMLQANGIDADSGTFVDTPPDMLASALASSDIDAAFIIAAPSSARIEELIAMPDIQIRSIPRADAYVRQHSFLSKVVLPEGVLDLENNLPDSDITTIALAAMLAAKKDLHPAVVDLLLIAATDTHGKHSLLSDEGSFPTARYIDLPLADEAARHFKYGPPFLMRYLPFWAATLVDRLWVMLLPILGLAIPLFKLVPPAYRWRIRRRLLRLYSELEQIDPTRNKLDSEADRLERLQRIEELDNDPAFDSVPREYTDDVYKLRRDIDLVRRHLGATSS